MVKKPGGLLVLSLIFCLLFTPFARGSEAVDGPTAEAPLMLYPAYLQTPLSMPVVLDAETYPAGRPLTFVSSDPAVATVDAEGCVTPVTVGEAVITCAMADDPSVAATCGVLVVAEGNILLWEYPPEPFDWEAAIARMEAEDAAQEAADPGLPWPDFWPEDLPKLDGRVTDTYGEGLETEEGLMVFLVLPGVEVAKAYVGELVSLGFTAEEIPGMEEGDYIVTLSGNGYQMFVSYAGSTQECTVLVKQ